MSGSAILGYDPSLTSIQLDEVVEKKVPVRVEHGTVPDGLTLGETTVVPDEVTITGPKSVVSTVAAVRASVIVQEPPINIDQDVPLVPIDQLGNAVSPVDVEPADSPSRHAGLLRSEEQHPAGQSDHHRHVRRRVSRSNR